MVNAYLTAFWSGDFDQARSLVTDGFSFRGPLAQADDRAAFFASAAPLAPIARGHELVRQWIDGDEVCSIYQCRLETAHGAGTVLVTEWDTVRDDQVAAAQLVFDTAAFRALLPARAQESTSPAVAQTRDTVQAYLHRDPPRGSCSAGQWLAPSGHDVAEHQGVTG